MINLPVVINLKDIERIREQSDYRIHSLGMLLYAIAYAKCQSETRREQQGMREPRRFVEIGFKLGYSALMLTAAQAESGRPGIVVSVDIRECKEGVRSIAIQDGLAERHQLIVGDSVRVVDQVLAALGGPVDLLFVDGDHSYAGCKRDFETYAPHLAEDGLLLFHDNYHPGVRRTLDEITGWCFANLGGWAGLTVGTRSIY